MSAKSTAKTPARRWFNLLFFPLCWLVFAWPVIRLGGWSGDGVSLTWAWAWGFALGVIGVAGLWYSFSSPKMVLRYVMVHWLGAAFILFTLTLVYEIVRWAMPVDDRIAVAWILGIAAALVGWAVVGAHILRVKKLTFAAKLTRKYRIVQISDVHIGSRQGGYLNRIVRRINRLSADVVVITGDLVDSAAVGIDALAALRQLNARVLLVIGNHERYADLDNVLLMFDKLGIEVLRQRCIQFGELQFIGIDDADSPTQVAEKLPQIAMKKHGKKHGGGGDNFYKVLLYHRPQGWTAAIAHGVDLMLCGHTHNGQIFPFNLLVKRQFRHISGLYSKGNAHLYVSPGTGTWGPLMRLGSRNEITCIDLMPRD